nr:hypothetical protein [Pseudomonas luteola]
MLEYLNPPAGWFEAERDRQIDSIERRRRLYRGYTDPMVITGRTVIVVDDGVATGSTARVALFALRLHVWYGRPPLGLQTSPRGSKHWPMTWSAWRRPMSSSTSRPTIRILVRFLTRTSYPCWQGVVQIAASDHPYIRLKES